MTAKMRTMTPRFTTLEPRTLLATRMLAVMRLLAKEHNRRGFMMDILLCIVAAAMLEMRDHNRPPMQPEAPHV